MKDLELVQMFIMYNAAELGAFRKEMCAQLERLLGRLTTPICNEKRVGDVQVGVATCRACVRKTRYRRAAAPVRPTPHRWVST